MPRFYRLIFTNSSASFQFALLRLLVTAAILCAVSTSSVLGVVTFRIAELKSPLEAEAETQEQHEEAVANGQRRFRLGSEFYNSRTNSLRAAQRCRPIHFSPSRSFEGHRLSPGVLAPLTC